MPNPLLLSHGSLDRVRPRQPALQVGIEETARFNSDFKFLDLVKQSNDNWSSSSTNNYQATLEAAGLLDSNDWPTGLNGESYLQIQCTSVKEETADQGLDLSDTWRIEWEGEGTVAMIHSGSGTLTAGTSGTGFAEYDYTQASTPFGGDQFLGIRISETDPNTNGEYIRNVKMFRTSDKTRVDNGEIYSKAYLDKLSPFRIIRAMDFMHTNNATITDYSQYPTTTYRTYSGGPCPVSYLWELANLTGCDLWICVPHKFKNSDCSSLFNDLKNNLNPNRHLYIEYSNETWNNSFDQAEDCRQFGRNLWNAGSQFAVDAFNDTGSNYAVDDTVTVSGGTGTAVVFTVRAVDGSGAITEADVTTVSGYTTEPSYPASTTTSGSGTGATVTLVIDADFGQLATPGHRFNAYRCVEIGNIALGQFGKDFGKKVYMVYGHHVANTSRLSGQVPLGMQKFDMDEWGSLFHMVAVADYISCFRANTNHEAFQTDLIADSRALNTSDPTTYPHEFTYATEQIAQNIRDGSVLSQWNTENDPDIAQEGTPLTQMDTWLATHYADIQDMAGDGSAPKKHLILYEGGEHNQYGGTDTDIIDMMLYWQYSQPKADLLVELNKVVESNKVIIPSDFSFIARPDVDEGDKPWGTYWHIDIPVTDPIPEAWLIVNRTYRVPKFESRKDSDFVSTY